MFLKCIRPGLGDFLLDFFRFLCHIELFLLLCKPDGLLNRVVLSLDEQVGDGIVADDDSQHFNVVDPHAVLIKIAAGPFAFITR